MAASAITDSARIQGSVQTPHAITPGVATQTSILKGGLYDLWFSAAADMYVKVGPTLVGYTPEGADQPALVPATDVTAANGYLIRSGTTVTIYAPYGARIGAVSATAGNLCVHKVGE